MFTQTSTHKCTHTHKYYTHANTFTCMYTHTVPGSLAELTVNYTSPTTAVLQWSPVPAHQQNGVITGYRIRVNSSSVGQEYSTGPATLQYVISNLSPLTEYYFAVAAETLAGIGPPFLVMSRAPLPGKYMAVHRTVGTFCGGFNFAFFVVCYSPQK